MNASALRFGADALRTFAAGLLDRAGVDAPIGRDVAAILVEADLLGHTTHGLALLGSYLAEIENGTMTKTGVPEVLNSRPAVQLFTRGWSFARVIRYAVRFRRQWLCGPRTGW